MTEEVRTFTEEEAILAELRRKYHARVAAIEADENLSREEKEKRLRAAWDEYNRSISRRLGTGR